MEVGKDGRGEIGKVLIYISAEILENLHFWLMPVKVGWCRMNVFVGHNSSLRCWKYKWKLCVRDLLSHLQHPELNKIFQIHTINCVFRIEIFQVNDVSYCSDCCWTQSVMSELFPVEKLHISITSPIDYCSTFKCCRRVNSEQLLMSVVSHMVRGAEVSSITDCWVFLSD